jgi:hypothetical protein
MCPTATAERSLARRDVSAGKQDCDAPRAVDVNAHDGLRADAS